MGLFDDDDFELDDLLDSVKKYPSCVADLNEGEVQAIFNRCLCSTGEDVLSSDLFPPLLGNPKESYRVFDFSKDAILKNKATIAYLFGQLAIVHTLRDKSALFTEEDFYKNYLGAAWTKDKVDVLALLYLGKCQEIDLIHPFDARKNHTTHFMNAIKPTLSPKDPAFPAWWEAHKGEWEQ